MDPRSLALRRLLLAAVCGAAPAVGSAGTVVWNANAVSPSSVVDVPTAIAVGDITRVRNNGSTTLVDASSASFGYTFDLAGVQTPASGGNNFAAAAFVGALDPSTSTCFQFTVTPANGIFSLERIGFGTRSTASGPVALTLRASADGYASDLTAPVSTANDSTWRSVSIPLTSPFTASTTTTFRLYGSGGTGTPSVNFANWRIDDLQLSLVPEPRALVGVGVLLAAAGVARWPGRGRRHRRVAGWPAHGWCGWPRASQGEKAAQTGLWSETSRALSSGSPKAFWRSSTPQTPRYSLVCGRAKTRLS